MHLPVMDHRNQAIKNPNAFEVNKNMMRCLVKAIACHGLGIHIYAGEDLPLEELPPKAEKPEPKPAPKAAQAGNVATPTKMEGREGAWQLTVTADPGADISTWAELVVETCKIALEQTHSGDDVKAIFKVNRNIFDRMKADAQKQYDELMAIFKDKKASFGETA
jgi:hypothetical protein